VTAVWGIVLAGGAGTRFGSAKQFATLGDRRLVVLVLPAGSAWDGAPVTAVVDGGLTRAESVRAGLGAIGSDADVVVITDAAHPVAAPELFDRVVAAVRGGAPAAIPGVVPADVVKQVNDATVVATFPRHLCVVTQMPQAFRADVLRRAHAGNPDVTEDSAAVTELGLEVTVITGDHANVHVVDPVTLAFAQVVHERVQR
jgi:2-C-methyl-D-erythritol 4-phosphate cytidylyltransferase